VHGQFNVLAGSPSQRIDEPRALFVAQRVRASHFGANAACCLIGQAIELVANGVEHNQASLFDQKGKEISDRLTSAPLLADAVQYLTPLAGGVQRLKETPPEIWVRGEQSGHVV
jgi:hypothetical protein